MSMCEWQRNRERKQTIINLIISRVYLKLRQAFGRSWEAVRGGCVTGSQKLQGLMERHVAVQVPSGPVDQAAE